MVVVYRVPAVLPDHVKLAFEERGVRLREGDRIVLEDGRPPVVQRDLDPGVIPFLPSLPVLYQSQGVPARRRGDRVPHLRILQGGAGGHSA